MKGIFVSGSGTGVGKTVVSRETIRRLVSKGISIAGVKPFETGCQIRPEDAIALANASGDPNLAYLPGLFRCQMPVSPYAAMISDPSIRVDFDQIEKTLRGLGNQYILVEGAGGCMTPLSKDVLIVDFISHLNLPVVLVSKNELGTISHTLCCLETLQARNVTVAAIVLNNFDQSKDDFSIPTNARIIKELSDTEVYEWPDDVERFIGKIALTLT